MRCVVPPLFPFHPRRYLSMPVDPIETLTAISAALSIVDNISGQIRRLWEKKPEPAHEPPHSVQAKKVDDTIVVERQGQVVQTITHQDIAKLDKNSQDLIKT